jgi:hypothetical protein
MVDVCPREEVVVTNRLVVELDKGDSVLPSFHLWCLGRRWFWSMVTVNCMLIAVTQDASSPLPT